MRTYGVACYGLSILGVIHIMTTGCKSSEADEGPVASPVLSLQKGVVQEEWSQEQDPKDSVLEPNQVLLTGRVSVSGDYSVVAIGADGRFVPSALKDDGSFAAVLEKDTYYALVILPGSVAASASDARVSGSAQGLIVDSESARFELKELGLDTVPTKFAAGVIDLGKLMVGVDGKLVPEQESFDKAGFLAAIGLDEASLRLLGLNDDAMTLAANFDANSNGVLDLAEDKRLAVSYEHRWQGRLSEAKDKRLDLGHLMTSSNRSPSVLNFMVPHEDGLPPRAKITLPLSEGVVRFDAPILIQDGTDAVGLVKVGPFKRIQSAQYSVQLEKALRGGVALAASGDYGIDLGLGRSYQLRELKLRAADDRRGLAALAVQFYTENEALLGVDYRWMVADPFDGNFRDASEAELTLLLGRGNEAPGHIKCRAKDGSEMVLACQLGIESVSGRLDASRCGLWKGEILWADLESCQVLSRDVFGTQIEYRLN